MCSVPVATDDPVAWYVCQSECLSETRLRYAKMDERIEARPLGTQIVEMLHNTKILVNRDYATFV